MEPSIYTILFQLIYSTLFLIIGIVIFPSLKKLWEKFKLDHYVASFRIFSIMMILVLIGVTGINIYFLFTECVQSAIKSREVQSIVNQKIGDEIDYWYMGFGKVLYNPGNPENIGFHNGLGIFPLTFSGPKGSVKLQVYSYQDSTLAWKVDSLVVY